MNPSWFSSPATHLTPVGFERLPNFGREGLFEAWRVYDRSLSGARRGLPALRKAAQCPGDLLRRLIAIHRVCETDLEAERFFTENFQPCRVNGENSAFFTGYHEPECFGSLTRTRSYRTPLLAPPSNLEIMSPETSPWGATITSGLRQADGSIAPPPTRRQIEHSADRYDVVAWVADPIEAFRIHVQGSARIRLADGSSTRLTYAGRNGRPYTSIAKILLAEGRLPVENASAESAYSWIRANGLEPDDLGRSILQRNESFIFFRRNDGLSAGDGPIGGASIPLTPHRSIAVDRTVWPYGLPFWIAFPEEERGQFAGMVTSLDTGSAIVGSARADVFLGWGAQAAHRASSLRSCGEMFVLLPRER